MAITLRPATVGTDDDAAIDIAIKNWLLTPKLVSAERLLPEPLMKTRRSRQNQAALNPGSWLFLVAVDEEGKVVGHLDGGPAQAHDDELKDLGMDLDNTVELLTIHVHPDYNRMGIGSMLTDAFFDWVPTGMAARRLHKRLTANAETPEMLAQDHPSTCEVIIWTWKHNTKSIPFYTKRGGHLFLHSKLFYLGTDVEVICFKWTVPV
ncbi:hypothetical protein QVD99_003951 [Batrachochytrium dendrobatidis]|nr:hypothetical protein O5D80_002229 [Batrachochytrium dendrobatidis]KAK5669560.1 hypothetical protein QVD99_003951 [Batrachochytrium dendrobatidis]